LPVNFFDTDKIVPAVVTPHARMKFDGNRYSTLAQYARRPVAIAPAGTKSASRTRASALSQLNLGVD
jgi:hypothetical protein